MTEGLLKPEGVTVPNEEQEEDSPKDVAKVHISDNKNAKEPDEEFDKKMSMDSSSNLEEPMVAMNKYANESELLDKLLSEIQSLKKGADDQHQAPMVRSSILFENDSHKEEENRDSGNSSSCSQGLPTSNVATPSEEALSESLDGSLATEIKAVIVGIHSKGLIVQSLPTAEVDSAFFLLDHFSECLGPQGLPDFSFGVKMVHIYTVSKLHDVISNGRIKRKNIRERIAFYAFDEDTWDGVKFRRGYRDSEALKPQESKVTCLIVETNEEDMKDIVRVVGPPSHLSFLAQLNKKWMNENVCANATFQKNEFIIADSFIAEPYFKLQIMFGTLCLIKDYEEEKRFDQLKTKMSDIFSGLIDCLSNKDSILLQNFPHKKDPPDGDTFLYNIRNLTPDEEETIRACCKEELTGDDDAETQFRLYIRDPALSICRFNSYDALKKSELYTIRTKAQLIEQNGELILEIELKEDEVAKVLNQNKGNDHWKEGMELEIRNPILRREKHTRFGLAIKNNAAVVIDEIHFKSFSQISPETTARIKLKPTKDSIEIFDIVKKYGWKGEFYYKISQIGPFGNNMESESLATGLLGFEAFYQNRRLFNRWRGCSFENIENDANELIPRAFLEEIIIRKGIILDDSQSTALHQAFHREGITSIRAGPGSGKTLLSGGLVCDSRQVRNDERMLVTATTNLGVNNVVEKVADLWPDFPISREMSRQAQARVSKELEKYCLHYQCLNSDQPPLLLWRMRQEYLLVQAHYMKAKGLKEKLNRMEMLHYAESRLKCYYLKTVIPFCGASTPALLVRHSEHYNSAFVDASGGRKDIKHIIVDEASQLPYYAFLALCCSFPKLKRITIIGDRNQLGPHCVLYKETGLLNDLCTMSELDRIKGLTTVEEFCLQRNYRSHPEMVKCFQKPHYGDSWQPARTPFERSLAFSKKLPLLYTASVATTVPFAFINIRGEKGDDCHNVSERSGVQKLLGELMIRNVQPAGISILCFHRKQKEEMEKCLKTDLLPTVCGDFSNEQMAKFVNQLGGVYTIDSFQGRENDIIIVCTTKTAWAAGKTQFYNDIFHFVADQKRGIVAMSRAKEAMYVFGQWKYLQREQETKFWEPKVKLMKKKKLLFDEAWNQFHF